MTSNELIANTYSHLYKIPSTGLRFFTVYGPWGRPDMAPMIFANSISSRKPIQIFNHGSNNYLIYTEPAICFINCLFRHKK